MLMKLRMKGPLGRNKYVLPCDLIVLDVILVIESFLRLLKY